MMSTVVSSIIFAFGLVMVLWGDGIPTLIKALTSTKEVWTPLITLLSVATGAWMTLIGIDRNFAKTHDLEEKRKDEERTLLAGVFRVQLEALRHRANGYLAEAPYMKIVIDKRLHDMPNERFSMPMLFDTELYDTYKTKLIMLPPDVVTRISRVVVFFRDVTATSRMESFPKQMLDTHFMLDEAMKEILLDIEWAIHYLDNLLEPRFPVTAATHVAAV